MAQTRYPLMRWASESVGEDAAHSPWAEDTRPVALYETRAAHRLMHLCHGHTLHQRYALQRVDGFESFVPVSQFSLGIQQKTRMVLMVN